MKHNPYAEHKAMSHTEAPFVNRMSNVYAGGESFFTDLEARCALIELSVAFVRVVAVRNCPNTGYTRLYVSNVLLDGYPNGIRWVGEPMPWG